MKKGKVWKVSWDVVVLFELKGFPDSIEKLIDKNHSWSDSK